MSEKNGNGNGDKLSRLLEKQKDIESQLAAEKLRVADREKQKTKRLEAIIGAAILRELRALRDTGSEKEAEALESILRGILASESVAPMLSESDKKLLRAKGWLDDAQTQADHT